MYPAANVGAKSRVKIVSTYLMTSASNQVNWYNCTAVLKASIWTSGNTDIWSDCFKTSVNYVVYILVFRRIKNYLNKTCGLNTSCANNNISVQWCENSVVSCFDNRHPCRIFYLQNLLLKSCVILRLGCYYTRFRDPVFNISVCCPSCKFLRPYFTDNKN
jgi:hypothetical protein